MKSSKEIRLKEWYILLNNDELKKIPIFSYMIHGTENMKTHVLVSFRKRQRAKDILNNLNSGSVRPCRVNKYSKRYMKRNFVDVVEVTRCPQVTPIYPVRPPTGGNL